MTDDFDARIRQVLHRRAAQVLPNAGGLDGVLEDVRRRSRRRRRTTRAAGTLAVVAVLGMGVLALEPLLSEPDVALAPRDDQAAPERQAEPEEDPAAPSEDIATCEGQEHTVVYRVRYPAQWWASERPDAVPCRWFHPDPFDVPEAARDLPEVAIMVRVQDRPFDEARTLDPDLHDLLTEKEETVDGRRALIQEYVARDSGVYPEGTTFYRWLVDADDRTLYATTADAPVVQADYDETRGVLDAIMRDLQVLATAPGQPLAEQQEQETACSAAGRDPHPAPQQDLPRPVTETRAAVVQAAVACDYDRLAELAGAGFTYSFGEVGDLAGYLRRQEDGGAEPLRYLAAMLDRPHATVEVEGRIRYVWPSAFAYDDWGDVPDAERAALNPLYGEKDFGFFEQVGGYFGYRIGITSDGQWMVFVAGD